MYVIKLKLNKSLIVFLMISVFAVGTITMAETVEAASWKKFDSGTIYAKSSDPTFANQASYTTYIKGSKDIKMNIYSIKKVNNKKVYQGALYLSKTGNKIKSYAIDKKGKKTKPSYEIYKGSVKQYYKLFIIKLKKAK